VPAIQTSLPAPAVGDTVAAFLFNTAPIVCSRTRCLRETAFRMDLVAVCGRLPCVCPDWTECGASARSVCKLAIGTVEVDVISW
jgi:hypothetical protein